MRRRSCVESRAEEVMEAAYPTDKGVMVTRSEWSVSATKVSLSEQVGTPALRALMWRGIGDSFRAILRK